jgi:hypothetical protein
MSVVLFDSDLDGSPTLSDINLAAFTRDAVYSRCSCYGHLEYTAFKLETLGNNPEKSIQHVHIVF